MRRAAVSILLLGATLAPSAAPRTPTPPTPVAPPAAPPRHATLPAASPDGSHVVFCSDRDGGKTELYVHELETGLSRRLTYTDDAEGVPAWTEGGQRIAYTVSRGDTTELRTVAVDGSGTRTLATRVAKAIRLSNHGRRIAWTVGSWTRNRIWVSELDGTKARALTDSTAGYFNLAWSPDDSTLAVTHRDSTGSLQIWLLDSRNGTSHELVRLPASEGNPQWSAWSPDGRRVAFQTGTYVREDSAKSDAFVCVVDVATRGLRKLRTHPHPWLDETPSWLDADHIVFQSTQSGAFEIWVMGADGSGARQLTK